MQKMERIRKGWFWMLWGGMVLLYGAGIVLGAEGHLRVIKTLPEYGSEIRTNADLAIVIEFNREVDPAIIEDFVMDQRGVVDDNGDPIEVPGEFTWLNERMLQFKPKERLKSGATYQVNLYAARTPEGEEMQGLPFRLAFKTAGE
jgi:hypothetical protein